MRKVLLIATLSLGMFAVAQTAGSSVGDTQSGNNDWYNHKLAAAVQMFNCIAATTAPSVTSLSEKQSDIQPESMASNTGSQGDWYSQKLAGTVQQYSRDKAATGPFTTTSQ